MERISRELVSTTAFAVDHEEQKQARRPATQLREEEGYGKNNQKLLWLVPVAGGGFRFGSGQAHDPGHSTVSVRNSGKELACRRVSS
jgi:hypothetical protein